MKVVQRITVTSTSTTLVKRWEAILPWCLFWLSEAGFALDEVAGGRLRGAELTGVMLCLVVWMIADLAHRKPKTTNETYVLAPEPESGA